MKTMWWTGWAVLGLAALAGCGSEVTSGGGGGGSGGAGGQGTGGCGRVPVNHRPEATACAPSTPATACASDADCMMEGATGTLSGTCSGGTCDYDECATDADCSPASDVCSCQGDTFGYAKSSFGSTCIQAGCHTDADCGPGGYCSPTVDAECGSFYGVQGFYCHSCEDACVDDSDCTAGGADGYCAYDPTVGHWACGTGFCAG